MYDLTIIGGGPAGAAAAVYAARKRLKTLVVAEEFGGQSSVSNDVENWIGTPHISGIDLAHALEAHVRAYAGDYLTIHTGERVTKIEKQANGIFTVTTGKETHESQTILITSGSRRKKLDIPGAAEFENKGITYCASCDGPLFADQDVVVIGGGNSGFESAAQLLAYCKSVTLIHRSETFRADQITITAVTQNPKMHIIKNADITKVEGGQFVESISYKDKTTGEEHTLPTTGIFVEVGQIPNTEFAKGLVEMNEFELVVIDPTTQATSQPGIWAAGDCTTVLYHQNNIAAGDGVRALEHIYQWLQKNKTQ